MLTAVLRRGYTVQEVTYPFEETPEGRVASDGGVVPGALEAGSLRPRADRAPIAPPPRSERRFKRNDPLPWILVSTLGRLSEDPDSLYDAVLEQLERQPAQLPRDHYRELFAWLAARLGRDVWIERSGSSIDYLEPLVGQFPQARFLHLHRDGHEVALSMREHHAYRLPISLLYDAHVASGKRVSELGPIDLHAEPTATDPITQILESRPPPAAFGRYWTDQLLHGY